MVQKMNFDNLDEAIKKIDENNISRMIISKPAKSDIEYDKIRIENNGSQFHITAFTKTQAFHKNIKCDDLNRYISDNIRDCYRQINVCMKNGEVFEILVSKKGKVHVAVSKAAVKPAEEIYEHNRKKNYILEEGKVIAPLVDMGIFTKEGMIVRTMYDKFRQINRFIEIIDDACEKLGNRELHIIDFGCGKSYLTFVVYYYFTEIRHIPVKIIGLDLKKDVIEKCNEAAEKYGYSGLHFEVGDINGFKTPFPVDIVMTLHACDTATDYALYNAVQWNARMIFSVPCCQHELNRQIKTDEFSLFTRYGIIKERMSALMTDAVRANMLEYCGYKTQLLEFIDFEHTPKNILIRAVKSVVPESVRKQHLREVENVINEFNVKPSIYTLLKKQEKEESQYER